MNILDFLDYDVPTNVITLKFTNNTVQEFNARDRYEVLYPDPIIQEECDCKPNTEKAKKT